MGIIFGIVVVAAIVGIVLYNKKKKAALDAKVASRPARKPSSGSSTPSKSDYYSQTR